MKLETVSKKTIKEWYDKKTNQYHSIEEIEVRSKGFISISGTIKMKLTVTQSEWERIGIASKWKKVVP